MTLRLRITYYRRVSLHKYDPPDLVSNVSMTMETEAASTTTTNSPANITITNETPISKREQQMMDAKDQGLLVDFGTMTPPQHDKKQADMDYHDDDDVGTPITVLTTTSKRSLDDEFGFRNNNNNNRCHNDFDIDDEDSDDDLL